MAESKSNGDAASMSTYSLKEQSTYDRPRSQLVHNTELDIYHDAHNLRRTGIICTIGPISRSVDMLMKLIENGLDVVRLNFSHGTHEYHQETVLNALKAAKQSQQNIAIALDTKGPEIRTGNFAESRDYNLTSGSKVRLTTNDAMKDKGTEKEFYVDYKNITKVCSEGDLVYIDDGLVSLRVESVGGDYLDCVVENSGDVSNHKGVNLPNVDVDLPAVSVKDKSDLELGVKLNVDMVFASFIRKRQDVLDVRKVLTDADPVVGKRIQIIAKIENHEGVRNFDSILREVDGVMVARGDLGIEIAAEKVFLAQKMMIAKCNIAGKPVIVATQMLDSMIRNPRPTRAEVSDVANAVLDGADCVMLSGETAKGKYSVQSVAIMAKICREAETARNSYKYYESVVDSLKKPFKTPETIASAAVQAAFEQHASAVIVLTNSGDTARLIAKFRPACPVIAVVGNKSIYTARQLRITAGTYSVTYDDSKGKPSVDERVKVGLEFGQKCQWILKDQFVVCVHADTMGKGFANQIRIIAT
mmetsp:Transcript_9019/g.14721  ORF Transcript_9019/g.14721 Transcript_9019/m.14721 type:complete len:530 (+) Transcript_9019:77-1666(+)|eukprot:CAMPEP_0197031084 /NCGR_PEP_ID=MMETSP1384-20130603/10182_1 /TAXON_ID=29189 /ORGANISM="Ammonia sp." /LENGTH=529 /DNA_ID=CAMNT_0042460561 /DNA_START=57 /DNA_END=1646 /DNA_ORIENTATION=-